MHADRADGALVLTREAAHRERKAGKMLKKTNAALSNDLNMRTPIPHRGESHPVAFSNLTVLLEFIIIHEHLSCQIAECSSIRGRPRGSVSAWLTGST